MKITPALSDADRQACFDIRRAVFIEEQNIPEAEEWDSHDATCLHLLARGADGPAGTARLIGVGQVAKIGRVAVLPAFRGTGLGRAIMEAAITHAQDRGARTAQLDAQVAVIGFYESLGFTAHGALFDDGSGILHRHMTRDLRQQTPPRRTVPGDAARI